MPGSCLFRLKHSNTPCAGKPQQLGGALLLISSRGGCVRRLQVHARAAAALERGPWVTQQHYSTGPCQPADLSRRIRGSCSSRSRNLRCQAHQVGPPHVDNYELVVGDGVALVTFALYKQISAIVMNPHFEGWLAPLKFNPVRWGPVCQPAACMLAAWQWLAYAHMTTHNVPQPGHHWLQYTGMYAPQGDRLAISQVFASMLSQWQLLGMSHRPPCSAHPLTAATHPLTDCITPGNPPTDTNP